MPTNRILLFSSSRSGNSGYLETAAPIISKFLGPNPLSVAFIPFAAVDESSYDNYAAMVKNGLQGLPYSIVTVHPAGAKETINNADVIIIGGGNTFKLLHDLYAFQLLDVIRNKVDSGTPYIGWSAGANIAGPGIGTTNDMPVIAPKSFNALGFLPFQINPHYNNFKPDGHNGETRDQRLEEFIKMNPGLPVAGLPEGTALHLEGNKLVFTGDKEGILFYQDETATILKRNILTGEDLSFLL